MICRGPLAWFVVALAASAACGGAPNAPTAPVAGVVPGPTTVEPFEFAVTPIQLVSYASVVTTPGVSWTGDIAATMTFSDLWGTPDVVAPGAGIVTGIVTDGDSLRLEVAAGDGYHYYVTNLERVSTTLGARLRPGDLVGERVRDSRFGRLLSVSVGVWREDRASPFLSPDRYPHQIARADNPLDYLGSAIRERVRSLRTAPQMDGRLSFDTAGTLMGFWYEEGVPAGAGYAKEYRNQRLWFFETFDQDGACCGSGTVRVTTLTPGLQTYATPRPGTPDLRTITPASGFVVIELVPHPSAPHWVQRLMVEMLADGRVRAEGYLGLPHLAPTSFTGAARTFVR